MQAAVAGIISALFLAEMTVTFEASMVYAAMPTLIREFGNPLAAGWLVTAHLLIAAATAPLAGRLGDVHGRKRLIIGLLTAALVGSVISAMTANFGLVLLGRALQGLSAAVLPLSIGVVRESLPRERIPLGIGLLTTGQVAGAAAGLILGGLIIDHLNWHALFTASAILVALSMIAVMAFVPSRPGTPTRHPIDWLEGLLPVPAIAAILLGISLSKLHGWLGSEVLALFAIGLLLMLWWGRRSLASVEPFIDLRLFQNRNFAIVNIIVVLLGMGTMQIIYVFSAYLQSPAWTMVGLGLSATAAGLAKVPSNFFAFFAGPVAGATTARLGHRFTVVGGALIAAIGWLIAMALPGQYLHLVLLLCLISFGTTALQAAIPNVVVDTVPDNRTSEAIGSMSVVRGIASALGAQLIALLLSSHTMAAPDGIGKFPTAEAYRMTMGAMAALTILGAIIGLMLRRPAPADR